MFRKTRGNTSQRSNDDRSRRNVLKTMSRVGALSIVGLSGSAAAQGSQTESTGAYGNGNGLGTFLNEEAEFKQTPWDGEITDRRGESVVDVAVGAMTSIDVPDPKVPPEAPFAFTPQAVKVSPGATVRWTWVSNRFDFPIPHDVTSLVDADGEPVLERDAEQRFHYHDQYTPVPDGEDTNPTFEFAFSKRGNHLYYCTPHGAPFEVCHEGNCIYNAFGMRGAVKVAGRPL